MKCGATAQFPGDLGVLVPRRPMFPGFKSPLPPTRLDPSAPSILDPLPSLHPPARPPTTSIPVGWISTRPTRSPSHPTDSRDAGRGNRKEPLANGSLDPKVDAKPCVQATLEPRSQGPCLNSTSSDHVTRKTSDHGTSTHCHLDGLRTIGPRHQLTKAPWPQGPDVHRTHRRHGIPCALKSISPDDLVRPITSEPCDPRPPSADTPARTNHLAARILKRPGVGR